MKCSDLFYFFVRSNSNNPCLFQNKSLHAFLSIYLMGELIEIEFVVGNRNKGSFVCK